MEGAIGSAKSLVKVTCCMSCIQHASKKHPLGHLRSEFSSFNVGMKGFLEGNNDEHPTNTSYDVKI
jgi:hypothetical protein